MKKYFGIFSLIFLCVILAVFISVFFAISYPTKYKDFVQTYSEKYGVSAALVASVINVESSYCQNQTSSKGAVGLMQLMPSTAEWLCQLLGEEYDEEALLEPEQNIKLGTYYLSMLLQDFESEECAICAYNAGPSRVKIWLCDENLSQDGVTLSDIPFAETKSYLNKVKKNLHYYLLKYDF